jgi:molybdopterin converting factor small subunit
MPHSIELIDGSILTPFGIRDLLDAVEDYAGEELRREIEEYIDTNVQDIDDYEKEYDRMEQDNERLADHQRSVLCNIRDEVDALDTLLQDTRLNRKRMQGAVKIIQQMIDREL